MARRERLGRRLPRPRPRARHRRRPALEGSLAEGRLSLRGRACAGLGGVAGVRLVQVGDRRRPADGQEDDRRAGRDRQEPGAARSERRAVHRSLRRPAGLSAPQGGVETRRTRPVELPLRGRPPALSRICLFRGAGRRGLFRTRRADRARARRDPQARAHRRHPHAGHPGRVGLGQVVLSARGTVAAPQARRPGMAAAPDHPARARSDLRQATGSSRRCSKS